ncbi:alpha/beta hydrolase [Liquorilactobacillus oeni]|uniref:Alpha/beta hydrolase n=1 Tax=Liquorilactobacillus oeni DSM 19972 TaxID=1423777 RepID=A0A0R1M9R1_9LACO|nr:alpha/beta hydrolase [Liquorilactobacillus oeni]KRL04879.1 hypothetical protein FD46_GL002017 [Liquorilactobacillus oeni DSM 19972]
MKKEICEPILFIHGYAGNIFSFARMVHFFKKEGISSNRILAFINLRGKIWLWGKPIRVGTAIQVIFLNSHATVVQQSEWLKKLLVLLKQDKKVSQISIIAHSMGAVSVMHLFTALKNSNLVPRIKKVVYLGAPFNDKEPGKDTGKIEPILFSSAGLLHPTKLFLKMKHKSRNIPVEIRFLNIIGNTDNGFSDGKVSVKSAQALRFLLQDPKQYKEVVFSGREATHRRLHESQEIFETIKNFLAS